MPSMMKFVLFVLSFTTFLTLKLNAFVVPIMLTFPNLNSRKFFLCFDNLIPTNFNILSSFPTMWDSMFWPSCPVSFPNALFQCSYYDCDKSSTTEGTAWQHVATTHTCKEAICPFCAKASSPNKNNLIGYTNPATLHQHIMFIHVIQPHTSSS